MKKFFACIALVALLVCGSCAFADTMNGEVMYAAQGLFMLDSNYSPSNIQGYSCAILDVGDADKTYFAVSRDALDGIFVSHDRTPLVAVSWLEADETAPRIFHITDIIRSEDNPIALLVSTDVISGTVKAKVNGDLASGDEFYFCSNNTPDYTYLTGKVGSKQNDRDDGCRYAMSGDFAGTATYTVVFNKDGEFVGITDGEEKIFTAKSLDKLIGSSVNKWLYYAGIGVGVIIVALVVIKLVKKPKAAAPIPTPVPEARAAANIRVYCSMGDLAGNEFSVGNQLTIGRDPARCDVVFPSNAPGVSAVHCRLSPMADGSVMLTDLGSSYGTFAGGEKLTAHVGRVMFDGETFELGDARNSFIVRI